MLFFRFSVSGLGFRNPFLLFGFWVAVIIRLAQRVKTCSQRVTEQPSCHRGRKNDEYYSLGFLNISEFRAVLPYITAASVSTVINRGNDWWTYSRSDVSEGVSVDIEWFRV